VNRKLLVIIPAAALLALGLTEGLAHASIPAPDGTINGCYSNNTHPHALYIRDSANQCPSGDTSLNFNQAGPPGPAGPAGPAGPTATLSQGAFTSYTANPGSGNYVSTCPTGAAAIGGNFNIVENATGQPPSGGAAAVTGQFEQGSSYVITVAIADNTIATSTVTVTALCLSGVSS
jgi:hypothetical protein